MSAVTGRLAPSPTGLLHLGHARSFLIAWLSARSQEGRVVMRMEDLDARRSSRELAAAALRDLEWLGLDWDGEVLYQSEHERELWESAEELLHQFGRYAKRSHWLVTSTRSG